MATIDDRTLIDQLIASGGYYEDDPRAALIVEYTTYEGNTTWGVTWSNETRERQLRYLVETQWVRQPRIIWRAEAVTQ